MKRGKQIIYNIKARLVLKGLTDDTLGGGGGVVISVKK